LLSDVEDDSTCLTLNIPFHLACGNCQPKIDMLTFEREPKKKERDCSVGISCQQYWLLKWAFDNVGYVKAHRVTRNYLGIEQEVDFEFVSMKNKKKKTNNTPTKELVLSVALSGPTEASVDPLSHVKINNTISEDLAPLPSEEELAAPTLEAISVALSEPPESSSEPSSHVKINNTSTEELDPSSPSEEESPRTAQSMKERVLEVLEEMERDPLKVAKDYIDMQERLKDMKERLQNYGQNKDSGQQVIMGTVEESVALQDHQNHHRKIQRRMYYFDSDTPLALV